MKAPPVLSSSNRPASPTVAEGAKLALGMQVSGFALADVDYATGLYQLSAEASRLFGLGNTAMVVPRAVVHSTFHPDDLEELMPRINASLNPAGAGWFTMDHRVIWPSGEVRWLRVRKQVFFEGKEGALRPVRAAFAAIDVTDERNGVEALRASEARLRLATTATAVGVWEWNLTTNIVSWDAQMFHIYDIAPTKNGLVSYQTWKETVHPEDVAKRELLVQETIRSLGQSSLEFRILRGSDGGCRYIRSVHAVRANLKGQPEWLVGTNLDITESKHAEEKMRLSELRYRRLFEAAHDGVLLVDPDTRKITDANPFMTRLLGYPHMELVGKELFEIGLLKDKAAAREMFRRLKADHEVRYENLPLESQSGQHQDVEVVANVYKEGGHLVIQCNIRDITARKQVEKLLRQSRATLVSLIEQLPVGVYVVDSALRVQQINPIALSQFNTMGPLVGRGLSEILHLVWSKRVVAGVLKSFQRVLETGESYVSPDLSAVRRDTRVKKVYEWSLQRINTSAEEFGVVCFFNDITERKEEEAAQRHLAVAHALNRKLTRDIVHQRALSDALKASQEMTSNLLADSRRLQETHQQLTRLLLTAQEDERKRISRELHDVIAQSLTGVNFRLAGLLSNPDVTDDLREKVAHTQRLIEDAVDTVHRFARDLRPAMIDDLGILPALKTFAAEFTKRTRIPVSLSAETDLGVLDSIGRTVLYRVAQEALTNVAQHAHATRVDVKIEIIDAWVRMHIQDDGQGFLVRDATCQAKPDRLGLLGMKERVEMTGGKFSLTSAPGGPTTILVEIPIVALGSALSKSDP